MSSEIYKTLYCSRNMIGGQPWQRESEIQQILQVARENNRKQDVTGALLFNAGYFAQVLEGPRSEVERIFEKIQRDMRHGDVVVLENGYAQGRDFSEWSMAYVCPHSDHAATEVALLLNDAWSNPAAGAEVLELLRNLVTPQE